MVEEPPHENPDESMSSMTATKLTHALRRAAVRATLAPSVHNTQPWRLRLGADTIEIRVEEQRRLRVLDPFGRQQMISCGCALFNARVSLAAAGLDVEVERFPDPAEPDLIARLRILGTTEAWDPISDLDVAIDKRRTNRRRFDQTPVPVPVVQALVAAAAAEATQAFPIERLEHRRTIARLSQLADRIENADPAYRAELRAWTSDNPTRLDGVPAAAVPHVTGHSGDEVPIRDFDTHGSGWLPTETHSSASQCLILLGTDADNAASWLRGGEGLERVLLEITRRGYAVSPFTQVIEVARTHEMLRIELGLRMHPHILLRVGRAPETPAVRRRRLVEVLSESDA
jgi:nitroreductase